MQLTLDLEFDQNLARGCNSGSPGAGLGLGLGGLGRFSRLPAAEKGLANQVDHLVKNTWEKA